MKTLKKFVSGVLIASALALPFALGKGQNNSVKKIPVANEIAKELTSAGITFEHIPTLTSYPLGEGKIDMDGHNMKVEVFGSLPIACDGNRFIGADSSIKSFVQDTYFKDLNTTLGSSETIGFALNLGGKGICSLENGLFEIKLSGGLHVFNATRTDYSGEGLEKQAVIGQQYSGMIKYINASQGILELSLDGSFSLDGNEKSHDLRTDSTIGGNLSYRTKQFSLEGRIAYEKEGGDQAENEHLFYNGSVSTTFGAIADLFGERPEILDKLSFIINYQGGKHLSGSEIKYAERDERAGLSVGISYDSPFGNITLSGSVPDPREISIKWNYNLGD